MNIYHNKNSQGAKVQCSLSSLQNDKPTYYQHFQEN